MTRKATTCIIVTLLLCVTSSAQNKVTYQRDYRFYSERIAGTYIPKDIDEAIDSLDTILSEKDKRFIADSLSMEEFCAAAHLGVGMWMRNEWGLWSGSRLQKFFTNKKVYHPDEMSHEILKAYYKKKIKGMDYSADRDIADRDIESHGSRTILIIKSKISDLFNGNTRRKRKEVAETRRLFDENGCKKGTTVYYQYPYGYSTAEEQNNLFSYNHQFTVGRITDIDYGLKRIKIKLLSALSPLGIIVFDGDLFPNDEDNYERDFNNFTPISPNRFYMQIGDELWFDLESDFWDFE